MFREAIQGQVIIYVNVAGDLEAMSKNIVQAMQETGVNRMIYIFSVATPRLQIPTTS